MGAWGIRRAGFLAPKLLSQLTDQLGEVTVRALEQSRRLNLPTPQALDPGGWDVQLS